jgi:hypothetical protein
MKENQSIDETIEMLQHLIEKQDVSMKQSDTLLEIRNYMSQLQEEQNNILLQQNEWLRNALVITWVMYVLSIVIILAHYEKG